MTALPRFRYARATSLYEAVELLQLPGARPYAGGTDLLVDLQSSYDAQAGPLGLVDVKHIPELHGIFRVPGGLRLGAAVTAEQLAADATVRTEVPALAQAAAATAAPAIRRRATLGGNLCTPHAAGDVATALLALDARLEICGPLGIRLVPVDDFLSAKSRFGPGELLLAAIVDTPAPGTFEKFGPRLAFCRATVSTAVSVRDDGTRVALGGVSSRPVRAPAVERALRDGSPLAGALQRDCDPPEDVNGSRAYRLRLAATLIRRCLVSAGSQGLGLNTEAAGG